MAVVAELDDEALTRMVRAGDERAVEELYRRHHPALLTFTRRTTSDLQLAEDLASEAFARTLRTVRSGVAGPSASWRPYLYAVARNTAAEWANADRRLILTAEFREDDLTVAGPEPADDLAGHAYRSLPPRWQTVLWHTLIEGEPPEQVAGVLGTTPGNVNVLAFRAREGLRKAYLAEHFAGASPQCRTYAEPLAAAVRKKKRLPRALRDHLASCPRCALAYHELLDLNTTLRAAVPIALLALGTAGHAKATSAGLLGWTVSGAVAAAAVAVGVVAITASPSPEPELAPVQALPSPVVTAASPTPAVRTQTPQPTRIPGARLAFAGRCIGTAGGKVIALPCGDPRTAWRKQGPNDRFQLVHVLTRRCLTAAELYDTVSFYGGIRAVRTAACSSAPGQRWNNPRFTDGIPRLVSLPTGWSLSLGKEFAKRPPTAFILYSAYTDSSDQRVTLK